MSSEQELLQKVAICRSNDFDPRADYVLVSVDKALWAEIQSLRQYHKPPVLTDRPRSNS